MSLFIGNLPHSSISIDLLQLFNRYGKCSISHKGNFAFIDFAHLKAAQHALTEMQGVSVEGIPISIEWSKKTKIKAKLPEPSNTARNITKDKIECYYCKEQGHISKVCKYKLESPGGHCQLVQKNTILENLRKNSPSEKKYRIKSPDRYKKIFDQKFNIVRLE